MGRRKMMSAAWAVVCCVVAVCSATAWAADWPGFRGPNRDGKSAEKGLLNSWPEGGPKLLWKVEGCGAGYGSPAVVGERIYLNGAIDGKECLLVLDLNGKLKAKVPYTDEVTDRFPGSRSTPTVVDGMVYVASPSGMVLCFDAKTLQNRWEVNYIDKFKGKRPMWKYGESPLVDGQNVIVTPGGPDATIVALDKDTGETVWTSKGLSDAAGYGSCVKLTVNRVPQIVALTANGLVGVSATTGQFLWRYDRPANKTANCCSVVFDGARVFAASDYGNGGGAADVSVDGDSAAAKEAWDTKDMNAHHGGYVLVGGYLYGNNGDKGYACLDWKTGKTVWTEKGVGKGCIIYADGKLYMMGERDGTVALAKATPDGYTSVGQFTIPKGGKGSTWAHPAIADGRLYIRHGDYLYAYDIKAPSAK